MGGSFGWTGPGLGRWVSTAPMGRVYLGHNKDKRIYAQRGELGVPFLVTTVSFRCELDDGMQWYLDVRQIIVRQIVEVGVSGSM